MLTWCLLQVAWRRGVNGEIRPPQGGVNLGPRLGVLAILRKTKFSRAHPKWRQGRNWVVWKGGSGLMGGGPSVPF